MENVSQDQLLLKCIRRINLDAFWGRETSTVYQNKLKVQMSLAFSETLGLGGSFEHKGPYPSYDHCGYETACNMVLYSRRQGKHAKSHTQFSTIRKLRSVYSNHCRTLPRANVKHLALVDGKGNYTRFATDNCGSLWFQRFIIGCQNRMGVVWKPNLALSTELLLEVLNETEANIEGATDPEDQNLWIAFSTYATVSYVVSLRGNEGLLIDLKGLNEKWNHNDGTYFHIPLLGKIKGETLDRSHLIPCINETSSGIQVKAVVKRLVKLKRTQGLRDGPAISDTLGRSYSTRELDTCLVGILEEVHEKQQNLFPPTISGKEQIRERYHCFRTWRKSSDNRSFEMDVDTKDIDVVNRWDELGNQEKKRPTGPMKQYYAQLDLLIAPFKRYTRAM